MVIRRFFTKEGRHPFSEVNWIVTTSQIKDKDGKVIFKQDNVEFPENWSQTAIDITTEQYFAGAVGSPGRETSLKQVLLRVSKWYRDKGLQDKYFTSEKDADVFQEELIYLLLNQFTAFNSPVYYNVGNSEKPQVSACFILSADDTMESIKDNMAIEMNVFRKGSGAGSNRSSLRSSFEYVTTGGTAMGPLVAEEIYDKIANGTKSGGKSRRAAKMVVLNMDHGNIESFIDQKRRVEKAAQDLIKAGWNGEFNHPDSVYKILPLQNFNSATFVTDAFMKCVEKDQDWALLERYPKMMNHPHGAREEEHKATAQGKFISPDSGKTWFMRTGDLARDPHIKVLKFIKAKELLKQQSFAAWFCADPGMQYADTINRWHTCKTDGPIRSSNPCSEYFFIDDTSCNLASHNLIKFFNTDGTFAVDKLVRATSIFIIAQDISVHNGSYPTDKIAENTVKYRTLGLGYTNLGSALLSKGLAYDSDEGRAYAGAITSLLSAAAYGTSADIASELGAFERYEENKESVNGVLEMHEQAIGSLKHKTLASDFKTKPELLKILTRSKTLLPVDKPVRNAQVVVIAPAGTISLMLDADTTGIEPMPGLVMYKKLVTGGFLKLTNPTVKKALIALEYNASDIEKIVNYIEQNDKITGCAFLDEEHLPVFATAMGKSNYLAPFSHVEMMAAVQPFVSGAISKTVNLPNSATVDDFYNIFIGAWKLGVKSVALYRDESKGSQPLNSSKDGKTTNGRPKPIRKSLPSDRPAHIHEFVVGGQKGSVKLGFYPDTGVLGEVWIDVSKAGSTINGLMDAVAIQTSKQLQYGISIEEIIKDFKETKFEPNGFTSNKEIAGGASSLLDYIGKYIEHYLLKQAEAAGIVAEKLGKEEEAIELTGPPCTECGFLTYKAGTCYRCTNCGITTGCA